ncbi:MAG: hypothetical protein ABSC94_02940 [Polyangiaceae bacterium]|jgi:hypothetical protein
MKLHPFEHRWAEAALAAIFPGSAADGLVAIGSMAWGAYVCETMARLPTKSALGVRCAVWLVAFAPLFVVGRFTVFARLGPADRERVIVRLASSSWFLVRSLLLILKTVGALLYAGDRCVRARMADDLPPRDRPLTLRSKPIHIA